MMLRLVGLMLIPATLLGFVLVYPNAVFTLPSLVVDLLIGLIIILPLAALQSWRSRKARQHVEPACRTGVDQ